MTTESGSSSTNATTTTTSTTPPGSAGDVGSSSGVGGTSGTRGAGRPKRSRARFFLIVTFLLVVGLIVCAYAGVFKPAPRIALVTSGDTPYWDLVTAGAREAA